MQILSVNIGHRQRKFLKTILIVSSCKHQFEKQSKAQQYIKVLCAEMVLSKETLVRITNIANRWTKTNLKTYTTNLGQFSNMLHIICIYIFSIRKLKTKKMSFYQILKVQELLKKGPKKDEKGLVN